uniref:7TM GPCR serpentine receptor class x (Srx) domain-containing protein n=1 Tax=Panagrolaimus davidi TaxID=227884 RepID=A0A914PNC0_9BILA
MLASFHIISTLNTNKWHVFLCTTVAWELCHMFDAFIVIAFNAKLKKHSPKIISKVQSLSTRATLKTTTPKTTAIRGMRTVN